MRARFFITANRVPTALTIPPSRSFLKARHSRSGTQPELQRLPEAGQPVPDHRVIGGHDISDILLGKAGANSPHETLYYENDGIRQGEWKLVQFRIKADWFTELYDLDADLGEQNDIADQHPDKVAELMAMLDCHLAEFEVNTRSAGFVDDPKPLLKDAAGVATLVEYLAGANTPPVAAAPDSRLPSPAQPAPIE